MKRNIDKYLKEWIDSYDRKVLLLRGARQVGKTYAIRKLSKHFKSYIEINFEEDKKVKTLFDESLDPITICKKLSIYYNTPIKAEETLLFFDEIQACPEALQALRFFYEKFPTLHVIAAGSLLEFTLSEIPSFGVGRISNLFMYPLTFIEFLYAFDNSSFVEYIEECQEKNFVSDTIHNKILEKLRLYLLIGGMPASVAAYIHTSDIMQSQIVIDEICTTLFDDFAKYTKRVPLIKLEETFNSIIQQVGGKFKYSTISPSTSAYGYKEALNLLINSGLAYKVYHTDARNIPLGGQIKANKFKVLIYDCGIYQRISGLDLSEYIVEDISNLVNKGSLFELFIGLELIANSNCRIKSKSYYWHREAKSSNAEVDYVIQKNQDIIPIEVKSGTKGSMKSMHLFLKERNFNKGIRFSQENFGEIENIDIVPAYAVSNIFS